MVFPVSTKKQVTNGRSTITLVKYDVNDLDLIYNGGKGRLDIIEAQDHEILEVIEAFHRSGACAGLFQKLPEGSRHLIHLRNSTHGPFFLTGGPSKPLKSHKVP